MAQHESPGQALLDFFLPPPNRFKTHNIDIFIIF